MTTDTLGPATGRRSSGVVVPALIVAILSVLGLVAVVAAAVHSSPGQRVDDAAMNAVSATSSAELTMLGMLGKVSIGAIVTVAAVCVVIALVRRRFQLAVGALVIIAGSNISTQLLKSVLDRPDLGVGVHLSNSLPSGHTTVVMSAVAALLLVLPTATRAPMALAGTAAVGITGLSTIVAGWHRPADVVAALLVVLGWTAIVTATIKGPRGRRLGAALASFVGAAISVLFLILLGVRPEHSWQDTLLAAGVLGLVAMCAALMVSVVVAITPAHD